MDVIYLEFNDLRIDHKNKQLCFTYSRLLSLLLWINFQFQNVCEIKVLLYNIFGVRCDSKVGVLFCQTVFGKDKQKILRTITANKKMVATSRQHPHVRRETHTHVTIEKFLRYKNKTKMLFLQIFIY